MFRYVSIGTNDIAVSTRFYDAALKPLGIVKLDTAEYGCGYGPKGGKSQLWVMRPYNKSPASYGNGTMIALMAESRAAVDAFHQAAVSSGGTDDGPPGIRGGAESNYYAAYVRDPVGNKISAVCDKAP